MQMDNMWSSLRGLTRRRVLGAGLGFGAMPFSAMGASAAPASTKNSARKPLDLTTIEDNIYAWCKTWGTLGDEPLFAGHEGTFFAVLGDQRVIPLVGYIGFGSVQFRMEQDGTARYRGKDATFYTDLNTGEILDFWNNPFTGERCPVYPYFNKTVSTRMLRQNPPAAFETDEYAWYTRIGSAAQKSGKARFPEKDVSREPPRPFILPWKRVGDWYMLAWDWMLEVPNPVTPEAFPKASTGAVINPSEHFTFFTPAAELEDRSRSWSTMLAGFFRQTPWLPWMRMGDSGVQAVLFARSHSYKITGGLDNIPRPLLARLERDHPDMLVAPTEWVDAPVASTWSYYAATAPKEVPSAPTPKSPGH